MLRKKVHMKILQGLFVLISLFGYYYIGYEIVREQSSVLVSLYLSLFVFTYLLIRSCDSLKKILGIGILFRLILLIATPLLSQDFYRFIWDGMLVANHLNPYEATPDFLNQSSAFFLSQFSQDLYNGMGTLSAEHYSNYPPLNQLGFYLASILGGDSILANIVSIRLLLILADLGIFWIGIKLLNLLGLPEKRIAFYFLNPLIIVELIGNLHWEGAMMFFFLLGLYYIFIENKWKWSFIPMAASIALKLIPLMILPLLWQFLKPKKSILFGLLTLMCSLMFFIPLFIGQDGIEHYLKTISLWFNRFEFNGSLYYIIRKLGYEVKGYNIIRTFGKVTPYIIIALVACFTFIRNNKTPKSVINGMLLMLSCYFFISTTVHPWYIVSLVTIGLFSNYSYPLFWSALVTLSYAAYGSCNFNENFYLISLQYGLVYGILVYEMIQKKVLLHHFK